MQKIGLWISANRLFVVVAALLMVVKCCLVENGFFWDAVALISRPATYLYNHGLSHVILPAELNITVATLPQLYTALAWRLLGRTLLVTHLAYAPFVLMFAYQLYIFCKRRTSSELLPYLYLFLLVEPTIFTQVMMLTPDLFLLAIALWCVNSIARESWLKVTISLLLLAMVSDRGILMSGFLMVYCVARAWRNGTRWGAIVKQGVKVFTPALLFVIFVLVAQKVVSNYWIVDSHESSPWHTHWGIVDVKNFFRNILVLIVRYSEHGRYWVYVLLAWLYMKHRRAFGVDRDIVLLWLILLLGMLPVTIMFYNPMSSRYFALSFIAFGAMAFGLLSRCLTVQRVKRITVALTLYAVLSNFVVYPERIAQGWDCSMVCTPYFGLRHQVMDYFASQGIDCSEVGAAFPMLSEGDLVDLDGNSCKFAALNFDENRYVLYSHIQNLESEHIDRLKQYPLIKSFSCNGVYMDIYKIR